MIRLEHFEEKDFDQLINWINTEELLINWAGSLFSFPLTKQSMAWYLGDTNDKEKSDALVYRVVEVETGKTVGHISLGGISRKNRSARISRVLIGDNENKGKGYCRQMINAVLTIAFNEMNLHKVSLGVYDYNSSALKCYQSAGFKIEGNMRDVLLYREKWWSLIEMGILEDEWKQIQPI
ncbi:MAG: N-acetyltransferase [Sphingobacteriales bacterium]|nr:MAG: N-acetyltransferase [Sphingobacteriales bacterium]